MPTLSPPRPPLPSGSAWDWLRVMAWAHAHGARCWCRRRSVGQRDVAAGLGRGGQHGRLTDTDPAMPTLDDPAPRLRLALDWCVDSVRKSSSAVSSDDSVSARARLGVVARVGQLGVRVVQHDDEVRVPIDQPAHRRRAGALVVHDLVARGEAVVLAHVEDADRVGVGVERDVAVAAPVILVARELVAAASAGRGQVLAPGRGARGLGVRLGVVQLDLAAALIAREVIAFGRRRWRAAAGAVSHLHPGHDLVVRAGKTVARRSCRRSGSSRSGT